jgi:SAM-dependent methyltransferase
MTKISDSTLGLDSTVWTRKFSIKHNESAQEFVKQKIKKVDSLTVLDVGCGSQPYKQILVNSGFRYFAHDFNEYKPNSVANFFGLHDEINYNSDVEIDYICDILEIDESYKFDLIICTEVLEHVPDPVKALRKCVNLLKPGGKLIITAPASSWTHQAPFYFSSGLSPMWFDYHFDKLGMKITEGIIFGDLLSQVLQSTQVLEFHCTNVPFRIFGKLYRFFLQKSINTKKADVYFAPVSQICVIGEFNNIIK